MEPPRAAPADDPLARLDHLVDAFVHRGLSLAKLKGLGDDGLEALYGPARQHLCEGRASEALGDLALLVAHQPGDPRFVFALGLALQAQQRYAPAARQFQHALLLDPRDAGCALRLAECLEALDESIAAAEAYRLCIELSVQPPPRGALRAHAEAGLDRLTGWGQP